jgi:lipopolysaccharide exporter
MIESLTSRTLSGLKWSYLYTILNVFLQIIVTSVLARILVPRDYGLMAIANIILAFGSYVAQMGIGPAIIQKKVLSKEDIVTAYLIALVVSTLSALIIIVLAPLAVFIFDEPDVVEIVRIMSVSLIFSSISMVSISLLKREFKFFLTGTLASASFIIGSLFIGITLAVLGFGVWSLVFSIISQSFFLLILNTYFVRKKIKLVKPNKT